MTARTGAAPSMLRSFVCLSQGKRNACKTKLRNAPRRFVTGGDRLHFQKCQSACQSVRESVRQLPQTFRQQEME